MTQPSMQALFALAFLSLVFVEAATAKPIAYKCVINESKHLSDRGALESQSRLLNEDFVVDMSTGRMNGALRNHSPGYEPEIVDEGNGEQAFKVVTIHKSRPLDFGAVDYLYVKTFHESHEKPFIYREYSEVYTGLCTAY